MLTLADDLSLPNSYVTSTGALLAVRGAGKSNTGAVIAEEMSAHKLPFVAIDPVGAWWGLRSAGDGKGPGLSVPIFGGKHGDLPLERGAGELIADLVVDERLSCVLDLSQFDSEGAKKTFLLAFAQRLYKRNEDPLHLFLEEADDYIPQKPIRDEIHLVRAFENIVRRGRGRGLGMTLITQRSAVINKNVLTQVETLFAMRTTGPQDIAAVEAWVKYHSVGTEVLASLAALEDGEAWVWSPHFLKTMKRVRIRRRWTFDSGATPKNVKAGETKRIATLADVDLNALQARMAATIEKANDSDPAALKGRIRMLERELHQATHAKPQEPQRVEVPAISPEDIAAIDRYISELRETLGTINDRLDHLTEALNDVRQARSTSSIASPVVWAPVARPRSQTGTGGELPRATQRRNPAGVDPVRSGDSSTSLDGAQQKILDVVAMLCDRGLTPNREMIARWLDIHPNGGRYGSNLARLRETGYLTGSELTEKGLEASRGMLMGLEGAKGPLDNGQCALVDLLDQHRKSRFTRETLAAALGIHPNGGRYGSNLARLRVMGLIPERGEIFLTEAAYR